MSGIIINRVYFPPWGSSGEDDIASYLIVQSSLPLVVGTFYAVASPSLALFLPALTSVIPGSYVRIRDITGNAENLPFVVYPFANSDRINNITSNPVTFQQNYGAIEFIVGPNSASWFIGL